MKNLLGNITNNLSYSKNRTDYWIRFINEMNITQIAEIGVYKGEFAAEILKNCPNIQRYIFLDPWRLLEEWNKPANTTDDQFRKYYDQALAITDFAKDKRQILRGKTSEVIDFIENESLDLIYIDGDHTLKGITIDLLKSWQKVRPGGFIGGDDFCASIWQHKNNYEPTLIFPFAVYFAEAMGVNIFALPFQQFLITKSYTPFEFINLTKNEEYNKIDLLGQLTEKMKNKNVRSFIQSCIKNIKKRI